MQIRPPPDWLHSWQAIVLQVLGIATIGTGVVAWLWKRFFSKPMEQNLLTCRRAIGRVAKRLKTLTQQFKGESKSVRTVATDIMGMAVENQHAIEVLQSTLSSIAQRQEENIQEIRAERREINAKMDEVRDRLTAVETKVEHVKEDIERLLEGKS